MPQTVQEIPEAILNGSLSMHSFKLKDQKKTLLPPDELAALEARFRDRHAAAVEKARLILRRETGVTSRAQAAKVLNDAFAENCRELLKLVK